MLVLARKKGQSIVLGDGIEIMITDVEGDTVRIGIAAPKDVKIYRKEVLEAIEQSNKEAAQNRLSLADLKQIMHDPNAE